jgi:hypothetical protein
LICQFSRTYEISHTPGACDLPSVVPIQCWSVSTNRLASLRLQDGYQYLQWGIPDPGSLLSFTEVVCANRLELSAPCDCGLLGRRCGKRLRQAKPRGVGVKM